MTIALGTPACKIPWDTPSSVKVINQNPNLLPRKWLKYRTTVAEAERKNRTFGGKLITSRKPFSSSSSDSKDWQKIRESINDGDELWFWESPELRPRTSYNGFCVVRNGNIVIARFFYIVIEVGVE
jgi:hypothetical protein